MKTSISFKHLVYSRVINQIKFLNFRLDVGERWLRHELTGENATESSQIVGRTFTRRV